MRMSLAFFGFLVLLFAGCSDDDFYSDLHSVNLQIEDAKVLYKAGNHSEVLDKLQGLDAQILTIADEYPEKQTELMPEFQLAIVYSVLSLSYQELGNTEQSRRNQELFLEQVDNLGIKDRDSVSVDKFVSRILKGESIDSSAN